MTTTTPRLRVAYIGHSAAMSGAEIALLRLLDAQTEVEPIVLLGEEGPLVDALRERGIRVEVHQLPLRTANVERGAVDVRRLPIRAATGVAAYTLRLAARLRALAPDLVHTNSMKAHLYGGVAARLARTPQIWHARDRAAPDYLPAQAVRLVRLAARTLPAAVIANSQATLNTYPGARNGHVVYDAALPHRRRSTPPPAPLLIGVVGRLAPWKGQHVFLRAFAAAFGGGQTYGVLIGGALFGEDGYASELRDLADSLGIADRVEFTGHVDDVAAQLDRLHVLVHCSTIPEPFGQVVIEGMAAGLPVIAADAGGPAEIIDHGRTGVLVPPNDVEALAVALERLAGDRKTRQSAGNAATAASGRYSPHQINSMVRRIQREVLSGSRAPTQPTSPPIEQACDQRRREQRQHRT